MLIGPGESHRHLDRVLRKTSAWADKIVVILDNADPDTIEAVRSATTLWRWRPDKAMLKDESKARNRLMELLDGDAKPDDLVVILDADEELFAINGENLNDLLMDAIYISPFRSYPCWFLHHWDPDGLTVRVDGGWDPPYGVRIYRHVKGRRIQDKAFACSPIPDESMEAVCPTEQTPFGIRHWGYAYPHDRARKHDYYTDRDGGKFHSGDHIASIITEPTLKPTREILGYDF
jgi:hypothetical protein